MQCPECDTPPLPAAVFCHHCGATLPAPAPPDEDGRAPPDSTRRLAPLPDAPPGPGDAGRVGTPVLTSTSDARSHGCASCGATNSPLRELCGRCGADLETGVRPPRPSDGTPSGPPSGARAGRDGHRVPPPRALVLGAVLFGALIVAGLTLAGLGPLAGPPTLPEAEFDPDSRTGEPVALPLSDVATSTVLDASDDGHALTQLADDDPTTAWMNDGARNEDGVGETIDLVLAEPAWVSRLVFNNGYQRDSDAYADHARIQRAEVTFDGGERVLIRLEDLGLQRQAVELPEPLLTTTVRIEVVEAFAGDAQPHLAVSDILLEGWQAEGDELDLAEERAEARPASPVG